MDTKLIIPRFLLSITFLSFLIITDLSGQENFKYSGEILNSRMSPINGATIYLLNSNLETVSDEQGNFDFYNLKEGVYSLLVSATDYATLNKKIVVNELTTERFEIVLYEYSIQLDGVVVTAQKKEELLQKVPISMTVLSARAVKEYRLWNSKDLTAIVPNYYSANPGDGRNVTNIRGVTTTSYDPAVSTYIDGVNQFSLDTYIAQLWDVERIEVLRGPQGTMYGRNAMGGVVNIITKQPTNQKSGFIESSFGNNELIRISVGIRMPLIKDKLFFGAAGMYYKRNGYYKNDFDNSSFDKQHAFTGNYYLKWNAAKNLSFTLNAKHNNNRNFGAFPLVNGVDESFANPFHLNQNAIAKMIDNTINTSLVIKYSVKNFDFSSHTAYQSNRRIYDQQLDADFAPIDGISIINNYGTDFNKSEVWTNEFKFNSSASNSGKLKWTAGSYLFSQNSPTKQAVRFGNDAVFVGAGDTNFSIINTSKVTSRGAAFFGDMTYPISQKVNVVFGARYDYEKKKYNILGEYQKDPNPDPIFDTTPDTTASINFSAFSPRLGITFTLGLQSDLFVTYSKGFRTGGLTPLSTDPTQPPLFPFEPEYSHNIEAGIKNNLLDNKLQLNFTLFWSRINNAQVPTLVLPDAVTITKNAGKLTSKGIELELSAIPVKGLKLDYNIGYSDATFNNLKLSQNGMEVNLDGKRQIFTPEITSMFVLQYSFGIGAKRQLKLFTRFEWMYLGKQYFDLANNIEQSGYSLLNTQIGISAKQISLSFWVRNLSDKTYISYAYDFGAVHLGDPKTYGLTLSTKF